MIRWLFFLAVPLLAQNQGEALYQENCATCHEGGMDRAPARQALREFSAERVLAALETGAMVSMASRRTAAERRTLAEWVTGKTLSAKVPSVQAMDQPSPESMCKSEDRPDFSNALWNGWGQNTSNSRFQSNPGISATEVPKLKVKWAFGFPGEQSVQAHSTLAGGRLFIGSPAGRV